MADIHNNIDYIDKFLRGELSAKEQESYTKKLRDDPAFRKLHEEQKLVMEGITYASRQEIKKQLHTIEKELQDAEASAAIPHRTYYRNIAAGLLLLIIGLSFYYIYTSYNNSLDLYDMYFNPPSIFEVPRTRGANFTAKAIKAYNKKDFKLAEQQFHQAIEEHAAHNLFYYQGLTKMQLKKFDEAEAIFKQILIEQNEYQAGARWYLALTYIHEKHDDEAIPYLQALVSSNNNFSADADNLLHKL